MKILSQVCDEINNSKTFHQNNKSHTSQIIGITSIYDIENTIHAVNN